MRDTEIRERWLEVIRSGERDYQVFLDGYGQMDMLSGQGKSKRLEFFFCGENEFNAVRVDRWKLHFQLENTWLGAAEKLDGGLLIAFQLDPFEHTPETGGRWRWMKEMSFLLPLFGAQRNRFGNSLQDFPPRQEVSAIGAAMLFNQKRD